MLTTRKRVPIPFLFRAADGLGADGKLIARAYGAEVQAVFTRAAAGRVPMTGGVGALPHSTPRLGTVYGYPALAMAIAGTNVALYSEDFSNGVWNKTSVTANALTRGGITFALLDDTSAVATAYAMQAITFTGNGTKVASVYAIAGTSTQSELQLFDSSAGAIRAACRVTWTAGVPTLAIITGGGYGTGVAYTPERIGETDIWRLSFSADSIVATNTNELYLYGTNPSSAAATGTVYFGGAQAQNATVPSPYTKTTSASAGSTADSCYFPFTLTPREQTIYVRGVELMNASVTQPGTTVPWSVTDAAGNDAKMYVRRPSSATGYRFVHEPVTVTETTSVGTAATVGDLVEMRAVLSALGEPRLGIAINGAAESVSAVGTAQALAAAWSGTRFYLNSFGTNNVGAFAFTHIAVALGTKTLAEMRELAEV